MGGNKNYERREARSQAQTEVDLYVFRLLFIYLSLGSVSLGFKAQNVRRRTRVYCTRQQNGEGVKRGWDRVRMGQSGATRLSDREQHGSNEVVEL